MRQVINRNLEADNLNYVFQRYARDVSNKNVLIGFDYLPENGIDLVIYDISEMLEVPTDIDDFYSIVNENCLDEESFEIDRYTLLRGAIDYGTNNDNR